MQKKTVKKGKKGSMNIDMKLIFSNIVKGIAKAFNKSYLKEGFSRMFSTKKTFIVMLLDLIFYLGLLGAGSLFIYNIASYATTFQQIQEISSGISAGMNTTLNPIFLEELASQVKFFQVGIFTSFFMLAVLFFLVKPLVWKLTCDSYLKKGERVGWKFWLQWRYMLKFLAVAASITLINAAAYLVVRSIINPEFVIFALVVVFLPFNIFFVNNGSVLIALSENYLDSFRRAYKLIKKIHYYIIPGIIIALVFLIILWFFPFFSSLGSVVGPVVETILALLYFTWARYYIVTIVHRLKDKV